ncbi:MAG: hypothetical protein HQL71_06370 [Magnetococcales bacterium]|nr:hypothetical protein [Magnetococcales bacterium]
MVVKQLVKKDSKDFVAGVVTDPNNPPNVMLLVGYPGQSSLEKHLRIYMNLELSDHIDIPEDDIIFKKEITSPENPFAPTYFWVNRDSEIKRKEQPEAKVESNPTPHPSPTPANAYFQGDIWQQYQAQLAAAQYQGGQQQYRHQFSNTGHDSVAHCVPESKYPRCQIAAYGQQQQPQQGSTPATPQKTKCSCGKNHD